MLATVAAAVAVGVGAGSASAATTAQIQAGTLQISGDRASEKIALIADPTALHIDLGEDNTVDFTFDAASFDAVEVRAAFGDDDVRVIANGGALTGKPVTIDGGRPRRRLRGRQPRRRHGGPRRRRRPLRLGSPATAATPSPAVPAATCSTSTARTSARRSTSPRRARTSG